MNYRLGTKDEIKELGTTEELTCPECKNNVNFYVYSNKGTTLVPEFPILKSKVVYFLICPKCSKIYGLDETAGKNFKKGEKLSIGNFDFKELKEFKAFDKE